MEQKRPTEQRHLACLAIGPIDREGHGVHVLIDLGQLRRAADRPELAVPDDVPKNLEGFHVDIALGKLASRPEKADELLGFDDRRLAHHCTRLSLLQDAYDLFFRRLLQTDHGRRIRKRRREREIDIDLDEL